MAYVYRARHYSAVPSGKAATVRSRKGQPERALSRGPLCNRSVQPARLVLSAAPCRGRTLLPMHVRPPTINGEAVQDIAQLLWRWSPLQHARIA